MEWLIEMRYLLNSSLAAIEGAPKSAPPAPGGRMHWKAALHISVGPPMYLRDHPWIMK